MRYKAMQARERGAVAVVFVTGPLQDEGKDKLPALANDGPESPAGIPIIQVKTSAAAKWLDLAQFQKDVDTDLKPRSRVLDATLSGNVDVQATYAEADERRRHHPGTRQAGERDRRHRRALRSPRLRRQGLDAPERHRHPQRRGRQRLRYGRGARRREAAARPDEDGERPPPDRGRAVRGRGGGARRIGILRREPAACRWPASKPWSTSTWSAR